MNSIWLVKDSSGRVVCFRHNEREARRAADERRARDGIEYYPERVLASPTVSA